MSQDLNGGVHRRIKLEGAGYDKCTIAKKQPQPSPFTYLQ